MMQKYLITGGSGFIGTHILAKLCENKNNTILNIDIHAPKIKSYKSFWKEIDICDKKKLMDAVDAFQPDYVIHLAARTDLNGKSLQEYDANVRGVSNLLDALDKACSLKQAIFASSMYVCHPGYRPKNFEDYAPHTLYGESKVMTEKIIKERSPSYPWSIIRPTSIWGPYFGEPYNKFFNIVLSHAYFHLGEKACKKTYGYIDNAVYQILSILQADTIHVNRNVFYIGDYAPYDITEWANEIATHENIRIPTIPFFLFRCAASLGDLLKIVHITFPMTSFRLSNMTTDNIQDLSPIQRIAPELPVNRLAGNDATIKWIKENK